MHALLKTTSWRSIRVAVAGMLLIGCAGRLNFAQAWRRHIASLPKSASGPLKFDGPLYSRPFRKGMVGKG